MMMNYQQFIQILADHNDKQVNFYLPNGDRVPAHFHITDIGSVTANFIDCGAQVRSEQHVQIQLWLGADLDHRLTGQKSLSIIERSQSVLNLLDDLNASKVVIEYQNEVISHYSLHRVELTDTSLEFHLQSIQTQCLAALRNQKNIEQGGNASCFAANADKQSCCA